MVTSLSVVMMTNIANQPKHTEVKKAVYKFMEAMLDEVKYCKTVALKKNSINH